ncbi:response regulator [Bradymonas sediminis]|nr:response regulator [Bradymonas sediminis]
MGVKTAFTIVFWAVVASSISAFGGSYYSALGLVLCALAVGSAPVVLRKTGRLDIAGHLIITPMYLLFIWLIHQNEGLDAPAIVWVTMLPLLASLFLGKGAAKNWLRVIVATWLLVTAATVMGYDFPTSLPPKVAEVQAGISLVGMGITAFAILNMKDDLQTWLTEELRQKERATSAVLETAPDGILTVDSHGAVLTANKAAAKIFGMKRAAMIGEDIRDLVSTLDADSMAAAVDSRIFGESLEHTGRREKRDEFPLEIAFGSHDERTVLVLRDITERKIADKELRDARDAAIEASKAKSAFLANMSHELRTPLNAVIGYSEMIKEEIEAMRDQELDNVEMVTDFLPDLTRIRTAGAHLLALINDILDLSKIEAGKMNLHVEMFRVDELIEDIRTTIAPLAANSNNTLNVEVSDALGYMNSDATKMRQVLFNLLSNACKFTSDGTVTMRVQPDDDYEHIVCEIEDTGVGMSEEQLDTIFDAFTQADSSTTREFGGTGLGLTITRHFCALLDGDIQVESTLGEGSKFTVRLASNLSVEGKLSQAEVELAELPRRVHSDMNCQTILVIDDDATMRDLLRRILEREGFVVATAASGSEGLLLAEQLRPDVITLDVMMPSMDGWTLLSKLKDQAHLADIPVIMVTMVAESERGYALGADHYMVKPIDRRRLVDILDIYRGKVNELGNILLVEDDEPTRSLLRRTLQGDGWQVEEAGNGQVALDALDGFKPDLVLLDLMMPKMDGFEFLRQFRGLQAYRDVPVIVVTAKELTPDEAERLRLGTSEILTKGGSSLGGELQGKLLDQVRRHVRRALKDRRGNAHDEPQ